MNLYNKLANIINCTANNKNYEKLVSSEEIYEATKVCPTCGNLALRVPVCKIQTEPLIEFLYCNNCKGYSASKMPTDKYLASYYNNYNYYANSDKKITFYSKIERFAQHICKYIKIDPKQTHFKIMDFGGGDGSIALHLAKKILDQNINIVKIHVLLVDFNLEKDFDSPSIDFRCVKKIDEVDSSFDIIIASAILEHIPDLDNNLRKIINLISKGGYFYVRVPYLIPFKKIFKNLPLQYPAHVHDLGPSFWNRIINRYNLDASIIISHPPLAETEFKERFLYTLFGYLFKFPAFLERKLRSNPKDYIWNYVAGWEIIIMINK
jgi:SAM-dependent methyltransferase